MSSAEKFDAPAKPAKPANAKPASKAKQPSQAGKILLLDPSQIVTNSQVRKRFGNIEALAESMKIEQQSPVTVCPLDPQTGKYLLQKGERRLRAAMLIPGFKLRATVDSLERTPAEWTASQLVENVQRENLTPYEIGRALVDTRASLRAEGHKGTGRELAKMLNVPENWISLHLQIAELPDNLVELIDAGKISDTDTIFTLKRIYDLNPELYNEYIDQVNRGDSLTREMARHGYKVAKGIADSGPHTQEQNSPSDEVNHKQGTEAGVESHTSPANLNQSPGQGVEDQDGTDEEQSDAPNPAGPLLHPTTEGSAHGGSTVPLIDPPGDKSPPATHPVNLTPEPPAFDPEAKQLDAARKLSKGQTAEINPSKVVLFVRITLDKKQVTGELRVDKICGDTTKGCVTFLEGGKPVEKVVSLDCIEILRLSPLAEH